MSDDTAEHKLEESFKSYGKEVFRYVAFKVADKNAAEDIVASVFAKLWEKLARGEQIENPRALLYIIAHGLVVDSYRSLARRPTISLEFIGDTFAVDPDVDALDKKQSYAKILEHIHSLKDDYREVILLYYVEGLTVAEVASIVGESENNIRVRVHRALTKLREKFDHERQ